MNIAAIFFLAIAAMMLLLSVWMLQHSKKTRFEERMRQNFRELLPEMNTVSGVAPGIQRSFLHGLKARASIYAGFELKKKHGIMIPGALLLTGILGWQAKGPWGAILAVGGMFFIFGFLLPNHRLHRRQMQMIAQVPQFIDQMLRSLSTGRSLESAIRFAADEASPPLRYVTDRVIRAADLGADMVEGLSEAARLHHVRELNLIALAMRISNNHGGSPRDMLESIVNMVRQQELSRRELSAMTGETRVSAWTLGLTPILIAAYIMVMNPDYLNILIQDPTGRTIMLLALALQVSGACILWRMLRSV